MEGSSITDWLKPESLRIARLTGFAGKLTAVLIALSAASVFCLKYAMNPVVQLAVLGCFFLLMLTAIITLLLYAMRHPERVMLEGSEIIQIEQIRMKNVSPGVDLAMRPTAGVIRERVAQEDPGVI